MEKIINRINLAGGALIAALSMIFGEFWYLFAAFAAANVADYVTGVLKARIAHKENSSDGIRGIVKKVCYWLVIAVAFFLAVAFRDVGRLIGLDLGFTEFIGWFTLCTFIINELRSILENAVELGVEVPAWLIRGLEVADKRLNTASPDTEKGDTPPRS